MKDQLFRRSPDALYSQVAGDFVALNVQRGQCYGMEKVTATVWELLAEPASIDQMCRRLVELYDVDSQLCQSDVARLIEQLQGEGLVEAVPAS